MERLQKDSLWQRTKRNVQLFYQKAGNDGIFDKAGVLAFQALFSIIPMLALAYFIFALSGKFDEVLADVEAFAVSNLAPAVGDQVVEYLHSIQSRVSPGAIGVFGVLGFFWAGISMISKTEQTLNGIWGLRRSRSLRQRLWLYAIVVVVAPVVLGASLAITSFFASQVKGISTIHLGVGWLLALSPLALSTVFFALVFWTLPYTEVSRRAAFKAGFITALVLEGLKQAFAFYAAWSVGNSIYGSLAALPILFLWLSLGATVFLLGAELCYFLDAKEAGVFHVARKESHLSFPMLVDILRLHQRRRGPVSHKDVVHELEWDPSEVIQHVQYLADLKLLQVADRSELGDECYVATETRFEPALRRLLDNVNQVKYEHLQVPAEAGEVGAAKLWGQWGVERRSPAMDTPEPTSV